MAFTAAQKTEINRMSNPRRELLTDSKLEKYSVHSLKARVNIIGVSEAFEFSPESDYTAQERAYIVAANPRTKWLIAIPEILERAAKLESGGLPPEVVTEILRGS